MSHGYNLFSYRKNDPVNMSDHTGHWPQWIKNVASAKLVVSAVWKEVAIVANILRIIGNKYNESEARIVCREKESPIQVKLCQIQTERQNGNAGLIESPIKLYQGL